MRCDFLTIFPRFYEGPLSQSLIAKAREGGVLDVRVHNLRDHAVDKHAVVDDSPYGGGAGMVFKPEPIFRAVRALAAEGEKPLVILPSAQGKVFTQAMAGEIARAPRLLFICPRYKGVDERVAEALVDMEISLGDYVLAGGDAAAWVIFEAAARLVPGVVAGDEESVETDSFRAGGLLEGPHYTRPREIEGMGVPDVLLSGNHAAVAAWRREKAVEKTRLRRPDLLAGENLTESKTR